MASPGMWQSPKRLYLNRDRTKVVPEGSHEQAHVLVGAGGEIPIVDAERYGLVTVREQRVTTVDLDAEAAETEEQSESTEGAESKATVRATEDSQKAAESAEPKADARAESEAAKETAKSEPQPERKAPPKR